MKIFIDHKTKTINAHSSLVAVPAHTLHNVDMFQASSPSVCMVFLCFLAS